MRADQSREEQKRQGAVAASAIMDTPREAAFDSIVFTAAQLFRVPMAMLAIVSEDRVWLKASVGPLPHETSIKEQFCATVVDTDEVLVVEDTTTDRRFAQFPIVAGAPGVRFYAGVPLHGPGNIPIATLCVLDRHPRTVPDRARSQLMQLAREAEELLRLRIAIPAPPN